MTLKLTIELVPKTSWFSNVRSAVTKTQWDIIRKRVYSAAYDTCEICGGAGPKHPVECHEVWSYNDTKKIQKLEKMVALCPDCHMVKHYGLAGVMGRDEYALRHFTKVNKLTPAQARMHLHKAFVLYNERSQHHWKIDISLLTEYGINISKWTKKI